MKSPSPNWTSGFAVIVSRKVGSQRHLNIECGVPDWELVNLRIHLLDKHHDPIHVADQSSGLNIDERLESTAVEKVPLKEPYMRAAAMFNTRTLRTIQASIKIPEFYYKKAHRFVLNITRAVKAGEETPNEAPSANPADCIWLETDRRAFKRRDEGFGALFWLVTKVQADRRIEEMIRTFPRLRRDDRATCDALFSLWLRLFSGDSPLLYETKHDRQRLEKVVCGAIKFAQKNVFRERKSRSKFHQAEDEDLDGLAADPVFLTEGVPRECDAKQLEIAMAHIDEVTGSREGSELCRRALQGETISEVAAEMGMNSENARTRVSRCRSRLGLAHRTKTA
jgi:hypothetical protein